MDKQKNIKRNHKEIKSKISNRILESAISVLISSVLVAGVVYAGSLNPTSSPASTMYTLTDIYNRLNTNAEASSHNLYPSATPAGTMYTLTQIYDKIPTIDPTKVYLSQSYLGIEGTLVPNGEGTAGVADLFLSKTANLTADWDLDEGTLTLACAIALDDFDGTANLVPDDYDGDGDGSNRWCMTDTGDATAADILSGKIAWVDGIATIGEIAIGEDVTGSNGQLILSISDGYYSGKTATASDTSLLDTNICSTATIFGVEGGATCGGGQQNYPADQTLSDNYDGTISDDSTGLTWQQDGAYNATSWQDALDYCSNNVPGLPGSGWHLPSISELETIIDYSTFGPAINALFTNTQSDYYWSSTSLAGNPDYAWYAYFDYGNVNFDDKTFGWYYARCVRQ